MPSVTSQAKYWMLTIPYQCFLPFLPKAVAYIKGQIEVGGTTGYLHWQILCVFEKKVRLRAVKQTFGDSVHAEPSKSAAAGQYVWKEETAVAGTRFELGTLPLSRGRTADWQRVWEFAANSDLMSIPADIRIRYYNTIKRIGKDYMQPVGELEDVCGVWIYGAPGVGKSRMAREEYAPYSKMCNKWWDGYAGEENILLDDFDKVHSVLGHHLKIWADRYPFIAEMKGGALRIRPKKIIVTSNYQINEIFADEVLVAALSRRFVVINKQ